MKRTRSDSASGEPEVQKRAKEDPTVATSPTKKHSPEPAGPSKEDAASQRAGSEATASELPANGSPTKTVPGTEQNDDVSGSADVDEDPAKPTSKKQSASVQDADDTVREKSKESSVVDDANTKKSDSSVEHESQTDDGNALRKESKLDVIAPGNKQDIKKDEKSPESKPTTFSSFTTSSGFSGFSGSGFKFQNIAKASSANPWAEPSNKVEKKPETKPEEDKGKFRTTSPEDSAAGFEKQQDLVTGEEDEETEYSVKVRLYAVNLDSEEKNWKERGVGTLKLNSSRKDPSKKRLLMRAESVLRVSLNLPLVKNTQLSKGFHSSLHTEKFLRISSIEDGHAFQFALRLASEEARDQLYEQIESALTDV